MTAGESRLGKGTGVMAAGTAVSRVLGLVRTAVLIAAVGANVQAAGAFGIANTVPNMLYMLIAGGLVNAVLVPQVVRAYRTDQGQAYVDRLLTLSLSLLLAATVLLTAAAPLVVRVVATSVNPDYIHLATAFALWCIPQVFFYGMYTLLGQILNARGSFGPLMWAPVLNNLVSIAGFGIFIAVFGRYDPTGPLARPGDWGAGPIALLGGVATLGIIAQALVLIIPLHRSGFRYRVRWDWRGAGLGTAGRVAGWTFGALLVGQIGVIAISRLASAADQQLVDGAHVAGKIAYDFSFMVFMLPHSLVTVSLLTSMFTRLSGHAAAGDTASMREDTSRGLRLLGLFTVLAAAVLAVVALPLVRAINPSVSPAEAASFAPVIALFSLGLPALGAWSLTQRIYYANEDAKSLFWIQVAMAGVVATGALLSALLLPATWWVAGAGASMALSYGLGAAWGGVTLRGRLGGSGRRTLAMHAKAGLAAGLAAAAGWPLVGLLGDPASLGMLPAMVVCVVVGVVMLAVDVIALRLLRVRELDALLTPALALVHRTMGRAGIGHPRPDPDRGGEQVDVVLGHGTLLAERYRLDHPVATDLPGVERWLAHDQILDREVTATVLRSGRVRQAQDGARRAALVTDSRLLRVLDVGDHEGLAYVVTERATGRTLAELTARGPLPAGQARAIVGEAAVALETARRRGVHHLALRPSSLHIAPDGGVVVSGLGIDGELREHGLGDARSTTRADTVALVALLYVALTGRRPGSPDGPWAAPVVAGTMVPPAELVPGVPNDLDTLCVVTLGPHDDGPHSPAELVRDLEPWGQVDVAGLDEVVPVHPVTQAAPVVPVVPEDDADDALAEDAEDAADADSTTDDETGTDGDVPIITTVPGAPGDDDATPEGSEATGPGPQDSTQTATDVPVAGPAPEVAGAAEPTDGATPATEGGGDQQPVVRTSVRTSLDGVRSDRPGTPPPAFVPSVTRPDPRGTSALAGGAARTSARVDDVPASAPAAPPAAPAAPGAGAGGGRPFRALPGASGTGGAGGAGGLGRDFDALIGRSAEALTTRRFNPAPVVLGVVAVLLLIGAVLAWNSVTAPGGLFSGLGSLANSDSGAASPKPTVFESPTPTPDEDGGESSGEPTAEPTPTPGPTPTIASAQMLDPPPGGDNNEHPEAVDRAIDGDPGTNWYSRTYKSPTYGMKSGIGYAVTLAEPATVTTVTLTVRGSGGMVEVRATDPSTPTEGTVLASGPLSSETVLTLSTPTEASSIVLWFTALPQTSDGANRIELAEVTVS